MKRTATIILRDIVVETRTQSGTISRPLGGISLRLATHERIGLMGRNGAGKTTLARLLSRLDRPTAGRIQRRPSSARVMQVFQRPEQHFTRHTVFTEIGHYLRGTSDLRKVWDYMARVNLPRELEHRSPRRLSGGQQRLVALACAIASRPRFLILDEPLAGLDAASRQLVTSTLRELVEIEAAGLVIISHHPDDLMGLIDRLVVLDAGHIQYDGPFAHCPVDVLDLCLASTDPSIYRWLRVQEENGRAIAPDLYQQHPSQIDLQRLMAS